jgi:hypothetical protein
MNEMQMNSILSRASQLMNDERFNSIIESTKVVSDGEGRVVESCRCSHKKPSDDTDFYNDIKDLSSNGKTGLPQEILESFRQTPSLSGEAKPQQRSLNDLNINLPKQQPQQVVRENIYVPNNTPSIDYSLIKTIVNECISSQMENIKQTLLNESTVKAFTIKDGNKVQFLSKNGDLYEGELKLKKRKTK